MLCVWAAVPGVFCAPFVFWQSCLPGVFSVPCGRALCSPRGQEPAALPQCSPPGTLPCGPVSPFPSLGSFPAGRDWRVDLRTPLLWLAGCSVLVVHGPGVQLFLPGVDALQAQALAAVLMEETP